MGRPRCWWMASPLARALALAFALGGLSFDELDPAALKVAGQFRSGAEVFVTDVSVLDRRGRPVEGLAVTDFQVFEDGVSQAIEHFAEVRFDGAVAVDAGPEQRAEDGRLVLIFMDDQISIDMRAVQMAKETARAIVASLGPYDQAAVAYVIDVEATQQFTRDRDALRASIDRFKSNTQPGGSSLVALSELTTRLGSVAGRRKLVLYVGGGERFDSAVLTASVGPGTGFGQAQGTMATLVHRMQHLFREAQRANVSIYTFDVNGLTAPAPEANDPHARRREFLQIVANESGGRAVINHNAPSREAVRVLAENASYYVIGYRSANGVADGKYRRIRISVARRNVIVRARAGYFAPTAGGSQH